MSSLVRNIVALLLLALAVRLSLALLVPIDLAGDESYYWEWGRHPDIGYFSKPPLIGWLMALLIAVGADTETGIRLTAALLGTVSLALLVQVAKVLFDARVALRAGALLALAPLALPSNLLLTIDSPLLTCWAAALLAGWHVATGTTNTIRWRTLLAISLMLGVLAKQIMLAFPLLWILWLMLCREHRHRLRDPWLWLVLAMPLVALLPSAWWNMHENWVTLEHTASHFEAAAWTLERAAGWFAQYVVSQGVLWGPVAMGVGLAALWRQSRDPSRTWSSSAGYLFALSAPALAVVTVLALRQEILPNWPAVFWLPVMILAAAHLSPRQGFWALATSGGLQLVLVVVVLLAPWLAAERNPVARVMGWDSLAQVVYRIDRQQWPDRANIEARRDIIVYGHRYYASSLAFYHPERPFVRVFQADDSVRTQYGIWHRRFPPRQAETLLVVPGESGALPAELTNRWRCVESLGTHSSIISGGGTRRVTLWRVTHCGA